MEKVTLNNLQLDHLALNHTKLSSAFFGTVPKRLSKERPTTYIINTDPHDEPRMHWIVLWTDGNMCEVLTVMRSNCPLARVVGLSFQVHGVQWKESSVLVQSKLWRLCFDVPDLSRSTS